MRFIQKWKHSIVGIWLLMAQVLALSHISCMVSAEYPPFEFYDDKGKIVGFDIDLADAIAQKMGATIAYENRTFGTIVQSLQKGFADMAISCIGWSEERAKMVDYSDLYYWEGLSLISAKKFPIATLEALEEKQVSCLAGSVTEIWLKKKCPKASILSFDTTTQAIEALKAGHVQACLLDESQGSVFTHHNPDLTFALLGTSDEGVGIIFPKGSALRVRVNAALQELKDEGFLEKLKDKWMRHPKIARETLSEEAITPQKSAIKSVEAQYEKDIDVVKKKMEEIKKKKRIPLKVSHPYMYIFLIFIVSVIAVLSIRKDVINNPEKLEWKRVIFGLFIGFILYNDFMLQLLFMGPAKLFLKLCAGIIPSPYSLFLLIFACYAAFTWMTFDKKPVKSRRLLLAFWIFFFGLNEPDNPIGTMDSFVQWSQKAYKNSNKENFNKADDTPVLEKKDVVPEIQAQSPEKPEKKYRQNTSYILFHFIFLFIFCLMVLFYILKYSFKFIAHKFYKKPRYPFEDNPPKIFFVYPSILAFNIIEMIHEPWAQSFLGWFYTDFLSSSIFVTLGLLVCSLLIGTVGGLIIAIMRHMGLARWFFDGFVSVVRGTPLILQLSLVYFVLPQVLGVRLDGWTAGILTFGLNSSAYIAEIFRSGIEALPKGQFEAARALQIAPWPMWKDILLPQVLRIVSPAMVNEVISLLKETALIAYLGSGHFPDIMRAAEVKSSQTFSYLWPLVTAGLQYYLLVLMIETIAQRWQKKETSHD